MNWWLLIGAVIGAFIAFTLLKAALGAFLPRRVTGRAWLRKRFKQAGILDAVSDSCRDELAAEAIEMTRIMMLAKGDSRGYYKEFIKQLDFVAEVAAIWVKGQSSFAGSEWASVRTILERHNVPRVYLSQVRKS